MFDVSLWSASVEDKTLEKKVLDRAISGLLLIVTVIHITPINGAFGIDRLGSLYGITIADNNIAILMRHRAVLIGVLGCLFAYASFKPIMQSVVFITAFVSVSSFFFFALSIGEFNEAIRKEVIACVATTLALAGAVLLYRLEPAE